MKMKSEILECINCHATFSISIGITKMLDCGSYLIFKGNLRKENCCDDPNIWWYNVLDHIWLEV